MDTVTLPVHCECFTMYSVEGGFNIQTIWLLASVLDECLVSQWPRRRGTEEQKCFVKRRRKRGWNEWRMEQMEGGMTVGVRVNALLHSQMRISSHKFCGCSWPGLDFEGHCCLLDPLICSQSIVDNLSNLPDILSNKYIYVLFSWYFNLKTISWQLYL